MQIRYLDTLVSMARTAQSKVIFVPPSPGADMMGGGSTLLPAFPDALHASLTGEISEATAQDPNGKKDS